ncbi:MAG: bifunctional UDP-N-acetylglucosamine diphosphorylase/glucosamine-1-phosphate N-acetyltransferase GlmU [Deltaproteobacteria bacterium]|nr:bifunctional UDP-N-acetylglucosamine diphosphorylase/glucosamine-1-phosphate N-acetyltransferase GlmU [Deltaproteobacteria bacterium]
MTEMAAVILAAGEGKRMKSSRPKLLHRVAGRPLLWFPLDLAQRLDCARTVIVVGHGREQVTAAAQGMPGGDRLIFTVQQQQRGTGDAVIAALPALKGHAGPVLILSGDVPLIEKRSITRLRRAYERTGGPLAFLTFRPADLTGYGRVIRDGDRPLAIREDRDCNRDEKRIAEVNAGIYLIDVRFLRRAVKQLQTNNAQGELYLTDLVQHAAARKEVAAIEASAEEVGGVNDRVDLARIEAVLRARTALRLMRAGVTFRQPGTVHVDLGVTVGADTELGPGVQLLGSTNIGRGCAIETGAVIVDSTVKDGAAVHAYSVVEQAVVGREAEVGPLGRLRPGAVLKRGAKVGNFVELKNTVLGAGSKANHLAYLGDGDVGERVNVGAGTIFCNYDGFMKHRTVLEDEVFIGSDSQLVAPVTVGRAAYVASGSTITKDVPADALAIARAKQENKPKVGAMLRKTLAAKKKRALAAKKDEK